MTETILVTGGAGFIGSHVVDHLADAGHAVIVLDDLSTGKLSNLSRHDGSERVRLVEADVAEGLMAPLAEATSALGAVTRVVHLAAQVSVVRSLAQPLLDLRTNQRGTVQVLELARTSGAKKVVFASSAAVYGDVEEVPTPESAPTRPLSPYGVDKLGSEHWLEAYAATHEVPTTPLRFFNVYGPRQDPKSPYTGVISIFLDRAAAGLPLTIFGDGEQTRDFVYVGDVARAIVAALMKDEATGPINVGTGRTTTVNELAEAAREVTGSESEIRHADPRAGEIRHSCAIVKRLEENLGIVARTPLREGLAATIA